MATILLVDDEDGIQRALYRALHTEDITIDAAFNAADAASKYEAVRPDVVVLDVYLPDSGGLEAFRRLRAIDSRVPIILITGHGTSELAINAMKEGAFDYLIKPLEIDRLRQVVEQAVRSSRLAGVYEPDNLPPTNGDTLVGRSPQMQEVYKAIGKVASLDVPVFIRGETGTGKGLVARAIHHHSARSGSHFIAVPTTELSEIELHSELFGHENGALAGVNSKRIGRFEQVTDGTVYLEHVDALPTSCQGRLLRLLESQQVVRLGGFEPIGTAVRVVVSTASDLDERAKSGMFRTDLLSRLGVFVITLPRLRDRRDDIPHLVDYFVRRSKAGGPAITIAGETIAKLNAYEWPGNVRELRVMIERALLRMKGRVLLPGDLPPSEMEIRKTEFISTANQQLFDWDAFVAERLAAGTTNLFDEGQQRMEREIFLRVLRHTSNNQLQAAKFLGITRGSLRTKLRNLGITVSRSLTEESEYRHG